MEEAENMLSLEFVTKVMGEGDKARFKGHKPEEVQALLEALVGTSVKRMQEHRAEHLAGLYAKLELCAQNVGTLEEAAEHEDWVWPTEQIELVSEVYSMITLVIYCGFLDNMEVAEEEGLKARLEKLGEAWKRLFGKIAATRPKLAGLCEKATADERKLAENWSDLFLGEVEPVFTPEYFASYAAFTGDLKAIAEGL